MNVSAIVVVRDGERYVAEAIGSVLAQSVRVTEVVVVDDGSTDGTVAAVAQFGPPVRIVRQAPSGIGAALNRGIAAATGDVLALLDADDVWEHDKLEHQLAVLAADPSIEVVFGLVRQFRSDDATDAAAQVWIPDEPVRGVQKSALLVRRSAYDRLGPFDESLVAGDFVAWWAQALVAGVRFAVPDVVVTRRRIHGANNGILHRHEQIDANIDALKAALDRRRSVRQPGS